MAAVDCSKITNIWNFEEYVGKCAFFATGHPLPQAAGWGIVVGFGFLFTIITSIVVYIDQRAKRRSVNSEEFSTAGRSIKTGFTSVIVVSHWTWAATLLQSSNQSWKNGISGAFWYASGATVQIILFGIMALQIKRLAPNAHTVLEVIKHRWGRPAHIVFLYFCILTNNIVTAMLILGGAAVTTALTGINIYAASILIPVGVILYTCLGGLRATFMADYIHTAFIYVVLCIFVFMVYASNVSDHYKYLGRPEVVWSKLRAVAAVHPVEGNYYGQYATMLSKNGLIFGIINILGNFATVFADQGYWQSGIAAKPSAAWKGYILGGITWFCIPFSLATALGVGARALDLPLTTAEAGSGLVPPAMATHLLGVGGSVIMLLMLFMAVTSAGSCEQIAVSSLVVYDIYKEYYDKKASDKTLLLVGRITVCVYGVWSGVIAIILKEIGLDLGWVYVFMGIIIGSAVPPIFFSLTWRKCSAMAAMVGAIVGQLAGLIAWLAITKGMYGECTVETTGMDLPVLSGNLISFFLAGIICIVWSLIAPQNFDWAELQKIPLSHTVDEGVVLREEDSPEALDKAIKIFQYVAWIMCFALVILWPCLTLPARSFPLNYFKFWVAISIIWGVLSAATNIFYPLYESRDGLYMFFLGFLPRKYLNKYQEKVAQRREKQRYTAKATQKQSQIEDDRSASTRIQAGTDPDTQVNEPPQVNDAATKL